MLNYCMLFTLMASSHKLYVQHSQCMTASAVTLVHGDILFGDSVQRSIGTQPRYNKVRLCSIVNVNVNAKTAIAKRLAVLIMNLDWMHETKKNVFS